MDQKSTSNGSGGGTKKNWRERLGINKDLPKIAAEFKEERRPPPPSPPLRPTMPPPVGAAGRLSPRPGQQISSPAPMAPRVRPVASAPVPNRKPGSTPPSSPPQNRPQRAEAPKVENLNVVPHEQQPNADSMRRQADQQSSQVATDQGSPTATPEAETPAPVDDDFSARLRAQREAAERLAAQRLSAARQQPQTDTAPVVEQEDGQPDVDDSRAEATAEVAPDPAQIVPEDADDAAPEPKPEAHEHPEVNVDKDAESETVTRPKFGFAPEEFASRTSYKNRQLQQKSNLQHHRRRRQGRQPLRRCLYPMKRVNPVRPRQDRRQLIRHARHHLALPIRATCHLCRNPGIDREYRCREDTHQAVNPQALAMASRPPAHRRRCARRLDRERRFTVDIRDNPACLLVVNCLHQDLPRQQERD